MRNVKYTPESLAYGKAYVDRAVTEKEMLIMRAKDLLKEIGKLDDCDMKVDMKNQIERALQLIRAGYGLVK